MSVRTLYDSPTSRAYEPTPAGREALQEALNASYRDTRVAQPSTSRDLRLDPRTLRTQSGYRYLSSALFRVCRVAAPGLSKVLTNLAGDARPHESSNELYSIETACSVFNQIVDLRFGALLSHYQMVLDERTRTIEGFLGPKTHYLENASFLELAEPVLQSTVDAEFAGATLVGRRLFLRYYAAGAVRTPAGLYRRGYAFCLTEAGDDAIRAYLSYNREDGSGFLAASPITRQRQKRTGAKFTDRLRQMLSSVLRAEHRDPAEDMLSLRDRPIFPNFAEGTYKRTLTAWTRRFKLAGTPADIAQQIVGRLVGADNLLTRPLLENELAALTEYDLLLIAMDEASHRNQRVRELVERAIFTVFFGD